MQYSILKRENIGEVSKTGLSLMLMTAVPIGVSSIRNLSTELARSVKLQLCVGHVDLLDIYLQTCCRRQNLAAS